MRSLITGVSGFVGSHVARALARRGVEVRALVRETSPRRNLQGLDVELVTGDLREDVGGRPGTTATVDRAMVIARPSVPSIATAHSPVPGSGTPSRIAALWSSPRKTAGRHPRAFRVN